jgi:hypothetical protein
MSNTKREGMRRVARGTNPEWARLMLRLVERTAREMQTFTADDVFDRYANEIEASRGIVPVTGENRAFGPVMMRAAKAGFCRRTNTVEPSRRAELHASPIAIWQSLLWKLMPPCPN